MPLVTTLGNRSLDQIKGVLPHEHIFTDTRQGSPPGFGEGQTDAVIRLVAPALMALQAQGIDVLVEATPVGVGRRIDILKDVSATLGFPLVVPTGIYREPWIPQWAIDASLTELQSWMERELLVGIEDTGICAGWIKLSAGNSGLTTIEEKILRAAARAARTCQAVIGSHTMRGDVVARQVDILEEEDYDPRRFIWIHTQSEADPAWHLRLAARGVWLEYDGIGGGKTDTQYLAWLERAIDAGYLKQVLISQDRGWYDPARPAGENFKPYTYLTETFLPQMEQQGLGQTIDQLIRLNPYTAFSREGSPTA